MLGHLNSSFRFSVVSHPLHMKPVYAGSA